jgi:DNA repair exonuclease SbcCD ATPase subunit
LKHEFNLAHVLSIELEQQIANIANSLKKCQDEKNIAEAALQDSKKYLEKLKKTHEDDPNLIENLCKDSGRNAKAVDELRVSNIELSIKNSNLAKTLSSKEQKIQDLEKALAE